MLYKYNIFKNKVFTKSSHKIIDIFFYKWYTNISDYLESFLIHLSNCKMKVKGQSIMSNKKSKILWIGRQFLSLEQKSEIKDRFGNIEIQSKVLKKNVNTENDLAEVFEAIKDYNIIIIQKSCFKSNNLKNLLEYNKEKLKKVFYAFCPLKRRPTRKELVFIQSADRNRYYDQVEV